MSTLHDLPNSVQFKVNGICVDERWQRSDDRRGGKSTRGYANVKMSVMIHDIMFIELKQFKIIRLKQISTMC